MNRPRKNPKPRSLPESVQDFIASIEDAVDSYATEKSGAGGPRIVVFTPTDDPLVFRIEDSGGRPMRVRFLPDSGD